MCLQKLQYYNDWFSSVDVAYNVILVNNQKS